VGWCYKIPKGYVSSTCFVPIITVSGIAVCTKALGGRGWARWGRNYCGVLNTVSGFWDAV
jgi:hypothetical protein